jgi:predicted alpha/beta-fold hydrolase
VKTELAETLGISINECRNAKFLGEPAKLAEGRWTLQKVDKMGFDSALRKEAKSLACVRAFSDSKDLYFQRIGWLGRKPKNELDPVMMPREIIYSPAWWIPGGHLQTLWGKLFRRQHPAPAALERWETPDGDFVDVHRLSAAVGAPRVLLLHGLEGTVRSHYAQGLLNEAARRGWGADLLIFRSCGSEPNLTRRFYHSGETTDTAFVLDRISKQHPKSPLAIAGVSLGGNVLLKFLGERGSDLPPQLRAAAAISVPFDLSRSSTRINRGFSRFYQKFFMNSLRRKALEKAERFPDLAPADEISRLRTLADFDNLITGPLHGFRDAQDYYQQSSSLPRLENIRLNTLLLSAVDDPMLPPEVLDEVRDVARRNPNLTLEFVEKGGHAGFIAGSWPWRPFYYAEYRVGEFFAEQFENASARRQPAKQGSR